MIPKSVETIFADFGQYDQKHKINTTPKKVPATALREIENGCSMETLNELLKNEFDIYKYRTQITIHGQFPDVTTTRIGGYANLIQNGNGSIGVRWNAIDYEKKKELFRTLKIVDGWSIEHNSQNFSIFKMKRLPNATSDNAEWQKEYTAIVDEYKKKADSIDKSLFLGNVRCYRAMGGWGIQFIVLEVNVLCFPIENMQKLKENISGKSVQEIEAKMKEHEEEKRKREKEVDDWWEEVKRKERELEEKTEKMKANFLITNRLVGYKKIEVETAPTVGDIVASIHTDVNGLMCWWEYWIVTKVFGKHILRRCDENGNIYKDKKGTQVQCYYPGAYVKFQETKKHIPIKLFK